MLLLVALVVVVVDNVPFVSTTKESEDVVRRVVRRLAVSIANHSLFTREHGALNLALHDVRAGPVTADGSAAITTPITSIINCIPNKNIIPLLDRIILLFIGRCVRFVLAFCLFVSEKNDMEGFKSLFFRTTSFVSPL